MLNESRADIYDYLYNLFYGEVTENVYLMEEPQELESTDRNDGFIVIYVGDIRDESEFSRQAYGWVRCYITAYVPPISRGRVDVEKYREFEEAINRVINDEAGSGNNETYSIQEDSIISTDDSDTSNANNQFFVFIKSFIVNIDI